MLLQGNCVKRLTAAKGGDLKADAGESFLIRRIFCKPSDDDTYLTLRVDRKTVGVYRVKTRYGNHLGCIGEDYIPLNLMAFLELKNVNVSIPVAEGQSFNVSRANEIGEVVVVYDIHTAGDILATMPNGSDSKEFMFIQYMDTKTYPSASGDTLLDLSLSPAEFPDFPCGAVVPARHKIEILGLCGMPVGNKIWDSFYIGSTFVKLIKDRECLFDEDRHGIPFRRGEPSMSALPSYGAENSLIGNGVDLFFGEPLMFDPVLSFVSGEELLIYITFFADGTCLLNRKGTETDTLDCIDLAAILRCIVE